MRRVSYFLHDAYYRLDRLRRSLWRNVTRWLARPPARRLADGEQAIPKPIEYGPPVEMEGGVMDIARPLPDSSFRDLGKGGARFML